jgi:ABC-type Mn2+/Zn2+ transport system permease subunit
MSDFFDMFRSGFLLHNALWGSVVVGLFCPLIGVYFMLRRMVLLGVALPQISAAGVAFAFFLQGVGITWSLHAGETNDRFLALAGSTIFTIVAILLLAALERRGEGTTDSRIGASYALAYAAAILFVASNAAGKIEMLNMLHGEIVSVSAYDLHLMLLVYAMLALMLLMFNRQFVLVSFDRQSAAVMGKHVLFWDALLYGVIGLAISIGVIIVGPMLTFAFLIIPPLAVRRYCRRMGTFFWASSLVGGVSGLSGFYLSYHFDWPLGPSDIAMTGVTLFAAFLIKKAVDVISSKRIIDIK